ncbi:MAG: DUF2442 domain-containing protein [Candidatus Cloacimonetes bacterium]|nr:DUF2442 domain-containing protein [Candidatus Cloacimonadota bacterium]
MPVISRFYGILIKDEHLFKQVRADSMGYGVVWNDDLDLSESELWINGRTE